MKINERLLTSFTLSSLLLIGILPIAQADSLREQIDALDKMAAQEIPSSKGEGVAGKAGGAFQAIRISSGDVQILQNNVRQIDAQIQSEEYSNAIRTVQQWRHQISSPQLRKMLEPLEKELRKQEAQQAKLLVDQANHLLKKAGEVCTNAVKPEDCDTVLEEMNDFLFVRLADYSGRRG